VVVLLALLRKHRCAFFSINCAALHPCPVFVTEMLFLCRLDRVDLNYGRGKLPLSSFTVNQELPQIRPCCGPREKLEKCKESI
jgi:hypothetical protein